MSAILQPDKWFPAKDSTAVVGRFMDVESDDPIASKKANRAVKMYRPVLHAKVAGSQEVSTQVVKEFNRDELTERFPGAWAHYEKLKAAQAAYAGGDAELAEMGLKGTPLDEGNLFNHQRTAWLKDQGFYTLEQVADMSDATLENMGRAGGLSARGWRKKAREYLAAQKANGR